MCQLLTLELKSDFMFIYEFGKLPKFDHAFL